jgi:hypothetical protein
MTPVWIVASHRAHGKCQPGRSEFSPVWAWFPVWISRAPRLLWVLSALGPVSSLWPVSNDTLHEDSAPSVRLFATGLVSSATSKPRPHAGCQKTCPSSSSARLSSARLLPPPLSSSQLEPGALSLPASLGLPSRLEPPANPALLLPAGMVGQGPLTSRCTTCRGPDSDWPCGSARLYLCRTLFHSLRTSSRAYRSGPHHHTLRHAQPLSLIY